MINNWVDIQVIRATISDLKGIKSIEAINDINIGNVTFTSGRLQAMRLHKGSVLIAGQNGLIT